MHDILEKLEADIEKKKHKAKSKHDLDFHVEVYGISELCEDFVNICEYMHAKKRLDEHYKPHHDHEHDDLHAVPGVTPRRM